MIDVFLTDAHAIDVFQTSVALDFDVIIFSKQIDPPTQLFFGFLQFAVHDQLGNLRTNAATAGDQTFVVLHQQLLVDTRIFAVQTFDETQGTQFGQVLIPLGIFGQEQLVVTLVGFAFGP